VRTRHFKKTYFRSCIFYFAYCTLLELYENSITHFFHQKGVRKCWLKKSMFFIISRIFQKFLEIFTKFKKFIKFAPRWYLNLLLTLSIEQDMTILKNLNFKCSLFFTQIVHIKFYSIFIKDIHIQIFRNSIWAIIYYVKKKY
jgi:hypothetical protein